MNAEDLSENEVFINLLKQHRIIFKNERTPDIKKKKESALYYLTTEFNFKTNQTLTVKQIKKKLNNLKSRLKQAGSNKHYSLKNWEEEFLKLWLARGQFNWKDEKIPETKNDYSHLEVTMESPQSVCSQIEQDDSFRDVTTDDLNRLRLISQIKAAEAQKKAAIAQERAAIAQSELAVLKRSLILQVNAFSENE